MVVTGQLEEATVSSGNMHIPLAVIKKYQIKDGDVLYFFTEEDYETGLGREVEDELTFVIVGIEHR